MLLTPIFVLFAASRKGRSRGARSDPVPGTGLTRVRSWATFDALTIFAASQTSGCRLRFCAARPGQTGAWRVCVRTMIRGRYVSHLRCLEELLLAFPALTGWATFWRTSGAPALSRSIWNLVAVIGGLSLATRSLSFLICESQRSAGGAEDLSPVRKRWVHGRARCQAPEARQMPPMAEATT